MEIVSVGITLFGVVSVLLVTIMLLDLLVEPLTLFERMPNESARTGI